MAITVTSYLTADIGSLSRSIGSRNVLAVTQSSALAGSIAQEIGTTYEAITMPEGVTAATQGWAYLHNLDSTNYVEVGVEVSAAFYPLVKLKAGERFALRFAPSVALFSRANTAAVRLSIEFLAD